MKIFIFLFFIIFLSKSLYSEIPNLENRNKSKIRENIANTYIRSMNKWDIPFNDLLENRSGSACINWKELTPDFLEKGIFDALGYSQNIPNKKASQIAAISGCKKMKNYYKLEDTCESKVILTNDETIVKLPIKKFNENEEFKKAVEYYKKKDFKNSYNKFLLLSEKGNGKAQYNLAIIIYKGQGFTQNYKKAYYWALMSKLNGQKKSEKLIKNNLLKINKDEVIEINEKVKEDLETYANSGNIDVLVPLAKWHLLIPDKPDYDNSYKWLSVASAFNIPNTKKARDKISKKIKKTNLSEIQDEANKVYETILTINNRTDINGEKE